MPRVIEFYRSRFVPDLATCDADHPEPDHGKCGEFAIMVAVVDGVEHYVCNTHLTLLCKEKWPVTYKGGIL